MIGRRTDETTMLFSSNVNFSPACAGSVTTFSATSTNGIPPYMYRWYINDVLSGDTPVFDFVFPSEATYTYRLEVEDSTGAVCTIENSITVNCTSNDVLDFQKSGFVVYPNPSATGNFSIRFNQPVNEGISIYITDVLGRKLHESFSNERNSFYSKVNFNLNEKGVYILSIHAGEEVFHKVIVH